MSSSQGLLWLCLAFVFSVFIASFAQIPAWLSWELGFLGIFYCLVFWQKKIIALFGLCLLVIGLGFWRTEQAKAPPVFEPASENQGAGESQSLNQRFNEIIEQNLPSPQSGLLAGILFGFQKKISPAWKQKMNIAGVRHIVAVSGMHVVLMIEMLVWFLLAIGLYRQTACLTAAVFIWLYIVFIGLPASAVRAGIMGSLLLLAQIMGCQNSADRAVLFSASIMLVLNPLLLTRDWGFQLSFLACLGIIYLMPFFEFWLGRFRILRKADLSGLLAMTFSAQIFTLPLSLFNFGYLAWLAPLTNMLIVPFVPFIMVLGFIFVIFSIFLPWLAWILSLPCQILLNYFLLVVDFASKIPLAYLQLRFSWVLMLACYLGLTFWVWRLKKQAQLRFFGEI